MTKKQRWVVFASGAVFMTLTASGCGKGSNSMVDQMKVQITQQNGDTYATVTSALNTGGLIIAGLDLPITKHGDPSVVLGHIGIVNNFCVTPQNCSDSELQLSINLSQIAHTSPAENTLPNGTAIPVGGLGSTQIVAVNIGASHARLYVGLGKVSILGVALPFQALDGVGSSLPGVNIFQPFADAGTGVRGIAGIFTGAHSGQSGFAIFADVTPFIPAVGSSSVSTLAEVRQGQSAVMAQSAAPAQASFKEVKASFWKKVRLYGELQDLSRSNTVLSVQ